MFVFFNKKKNLHSKKESTVYLENRLIFLHSSLEEMFLIMTEDKIFNRRYH